MLCWLFWATLRLSASQAQDNETKKTAVPDPAAQKDAEKLIREVFKDDYAKRQPAERTLLARKLVTQGIETKDDPVTRFVLLREARDLAVQGGDLDLALRAIEELGKSYVVEVVSMKSGVLGTLGKNAKTTDELVGWAKEHLKLAAEAIASDEFEAADKEAELAIRLAKRGRDAVLASKAESQRKAVAERKAKHDQLKSARSKLEADPKDPSASLLVGQYECFIKGNWQKGLPLLAQAPDGVQKDLAQRDLSNPTGAVEQLEVGDGWWDLREKEKGVSRENLGNRALHWYQLADAKLTGLNKTKATQRLSTLRLEKLGRGEWVDVTDASLFGRKGKAGDPLEVPGKAGELAVSIVLDKFPAGEFDGWSARIRPESVQLQVALVVFEGQSIGASINPGKEECAILKRLPGGENWEYLVRGKMPRPLECLLTVFIQEGEYVAYVDGEEFGRIKTTNARISRIELVAHGALIKVDQLRLRRKG